MLVWIHGGGFLAGSPASPWYDGRAFARDGIVTVTPGYRLGVEQGSPRWTAYPRTSGCGDLLLALDWVRENIAAFGGDPGRVTLAGQSAGGAAVLALLSSPLGGDRFQRAVSVSGGFFEVGADAARDFAGRLGDRLGVPPTRDGFGGLTVESVQRGVRLLRSEGGDDGSPVLGPVVGDDVLPVPVAEGIALYGYDEPLLLGRRATSSSAAPPGPRDAAARAAGTRVTDTLFRTASARARRRRGATPPQAPGCTPSNGPPPSSAAPCTAPTSRSSSTCSTRREPPRPSAPGRPPTSPQPCTPTWPHSSTAGRRPGSGRPGGAAIPPQIRRARGDTDGLDTTGVYDPVVAGSDPTEAR